MSEFKKGDRVQVNANCPARRFAGRYGTVAYEDSSANRVYSVGVHVDDDPDYTPRNFHPAELRFVAPSSDPKPLRFEDVRTRDTITVEVEGRFTLTGTAIVNLDKSVDVAGAGWTFAHRPDGSSWRTEYSRMKATLIAHTPAEPEPEWHRAQVIKADHATAPKNHWVRLGLDLWSNGTRTVHTDSGELTNVKIIVDAEGQVRA